MPKFSIIIPTCGVSNMLQNCLDSIKRNSKDHEIIVVNNGESTIWADGVIAVENGKNLGFPIAVNQGIKKATGEVIVILNNDTIVTPGWLDHLADHLQYADMVGPVTNEISGPQKKFVDYFDSNDGLNRFSRANYDKYKLQSTPWHRLVFFCVAIKREVIDKIGLLDEQFSPGNFEDDDFCFRALDAGFRLVIAEDVFIFHLGSATHKALNLDYQKLLETNQAKFEKKWPFEKQAELRRKAQTFERKLECKNKKTLALVMVVKNEEKGLETAVNSAKAICDEIVICVDDSSTDKTLEIARRLTPNVKSFKWCDDWSAMRNFAHLGVKSDWILYLDGHETLENPENVKKYLAGDHDGVLGRVRMETGTLFPTPRIYKNGCQFHGPIHEQLDCKNTVQASDVVIQHNRLGLQSEEAAKEREKQRDDLMPRLMGTQIKGDKHNTRAAFHLALFYQSKGDYRRARKYEKLYLKYADVAGGKWYMCYNIVLGYIARKQYFRAWLWTCEACKYNPYRWEISELRGLIFFYQKNYAKAAEFFVESFNPSKGDISFEPKKRNLSLTWNFIGECLFNQGEYFKASEAFNQAKVGCEDKIIKKVLERRANLMREIAKKTKADLK